MTREVILKCYHGDNCSQIVIFTRKYGRTQCPKIAELYSPIAITDGSGRKIMIHGDGRIRKSRNWKRVEDIMKYEEDLGEHGMRL